MDLFGGSKLKAPQKTLAQLAARLPGSADEASGGKLLAIPYADTAAGTAFEQLSRAWAPFKEAYYYTQRRGFAAPRPSPALVRTTSLCAGRRLLAVSLAERMPVIARAARQDGPERVRAFAEGRRSSAPASALQHYPRNEPVAQEMREKAQAWLDSREQSRLSAEALFRTVTSGHIEGPGAVAVPSNDECLSVPTLKSETLTSDAGVLVRRSPYEKPNLRPFAASLVGSALDGDPPCPTRIRGSNCWQSFGEGLAFTFLMCAPPAAQRKLHRHGPALDRQILKAACKPAMPISGSAVHNRGRCRKLVLQRKQSSSDHLGVQHPEL